MKSSRKNKLALTDRNYKDKVKEARIQYPIQMFGNSIKSLKINKYSKVSSSNTFREAHAGFFRLLMKENFDPYVLWPFDKKFIS